MSNYNSQLQSNNTDLQTVLQTLQTKASGTKLPELTNEGSAADLLSGKELIDGDGNKVIGTIETFDGSYECSGESTGGGKDEFISITIDATQGLSCHYIDENFSFITFEGEKATVMAYRGVVWIEYGIIEIDAWQATGDYIAFEGQLLWIFRSNGGTFVCTHNQFEGQ